MGGISPVYHDERRAYLHDCRGLIMIEISWLELLSILMLGVIIGLITALVLSRPRYAYIG